MQRTQTSDPATTAATDAPVTWEEIERRLRRIAHRRAALDAEELRWLVAARAVQLHVKAGCATLLDYLVDKLGYTRRVASERLRVADATASLPIITEALRTGHLSFSAVREIIRVVRPETQSAWLAAAVGLPVREVEQLVAHKQPGSLPEPAATRRDAGMHRLNVKAETLALFMQAKAELEAEHGVRMTRDEALVAMSRAVLERGRARREAPSPQVSRHVQVTAPAGGGPIWKVSYGRCAVLDCGTTEGLVKRLVIVREAGRLDTTQAPILCSGHRDGLDDGRLRASIAPDGQLRFAATHPTGPADAPPSRPTVAATPTGPARSTETVSRSTGKTRGSRKRERRRDRSRRAAARSRTAQAEGAPMPRTASPPARTSTAHRGSPRSVT